MICSLTSLTCQIHCSTHGGNSTIDEKTRYWHLCVIILLQKARNMSHELKQKNLPNSCKVCDLANSSTPCYLPEMLSEVVTSVQKWRLVQLVLLLAPTELTDGIVWSFCQSLKNPPTWETQGWDRIVWVLKHKHEACGSMFKKVSAVNRHDSVSGTVAQAGSLVSYFKV